MSYRIACTDKALEGVEKLKKPGNKPALTKIRKLLDVLTIHRYGPASTIEVWTGGFLITQDQPRTPSRLRRR